MPSPVLEPSATPARLTAEQLEQTTRYVYSMQGVVREYVATLELALETASVDSSVSMAYSREVAVTNLRNIFRTQDDIEEYSLRLVLAPAPSNALLFKSLMSSSLSSATEGLEILFGGYEKYAEDAGFPTKDDLELFAKLRGKAESSLVVAKGILERATEEIGRLENEVNLEWETIDSSGEQQYSLIMDVFSDTFYDHRKEFNDGLERIGARVRSATTESEYHDALEEALAHLEKAQRLFLEDRDNFAGITPPARFREAHILIGSVLRDFVEATGSYVTYYSMNLNQGTQDIELANRASDLLRMANENLQRAGYMYADLLD